MQPLPTPDLISDLIETEAYRYQLAYEGFMVSSHKKRLKDHKKRIVWTALVIILMLLFSAFCIFLGIRLLGSEDQGWQKMIATLTMPSTMRSTASPARAPPSGVPP